MISGAIATPRRLIGALALLAAVVGCDNSQTRVPSRWWHNRASRGYLYLGRDAVLSPNSAGCDTE